MDWLDALRQLPSGAVQVRHSPPTPRYGRAARSVPHLLRSGVILGTQPDHERPHALLLAVWAPSTSRRSRGYYACFRLRFTDDSLSAAVLYCFYDGRDNSPALGSPETAALFARQHGFNTE